MTPADPTLFEVQVSPAAHHGCALCAGAADGCRWCNPAKMPATVCPAWLGGATASQVRNVNAGLHPLGHAKLLADVLAGDEAAPTCRTCAHLVRRTRSKTWLKCAKARQTSGPATDTRARWGACTLYEVEP